MTFYYRKLPLEFSREGKALTPFIPMVARITLRSDWWIGDKDEWRALLSQDLRKDLRGDSGVKMEKFHLNP